MNDMSYWLNNGYKIDDYMKLSYLEKTFLHYSRFEHYKEEKEKTKYLAYIMNGGEI